MSQPHTQLSVFLRQGEWLLDEAAFAVGGQHYSPTQCRRAATVLDELAAALRQHADLLPSGEPTTGELPTGEPPTEPPPDDRDDEPDG
ncbi:hypothetical protein SAMN04487905_11179 [Actinopolyspora xinjiangensis]|uniref:Uncharacterized protein n=1 Tax=Actinopolyspora xinjiangensis TaxID=405564 RepID=A0A1H0W944_9ACTN|nr:hypothetical protein [Actinopolyspora xinjiangensis]SDP87264.1 hypothetical protein SAMN04487905_11179 [Actinopolyspora xinjiangensis]